MKQIISIIVPVYNAEQSIKRCLDSLLGQSIQNFIIYVVNDGSTDDTLKVLKNYENNSKIKIINQKNEGVSRARNRALKEVATAYVAFVDADDYVTQDYLRHMIEGYNNKLVDLVIEQSTNREKNSIIISSKAMRRLIGRNGVGGYLWNKLFKTKIIKKNNLTFKNNLKIAEDLVFCEEYLLHCNFVSFLPYSDYIYLRDSNSTSNKGQLVNYTSEFYINYNYALKELLKLIPKQYKKLSSDLMAEICNVNFDYFRMLKLQRKDANFEINHAMSEILLNRRKFMMSRNVEKKRKIMLLVFSFSPRIITMIDKINARRK